ncbi:rhodanese-like domain-containing protein [Rhodococcus sp. ACPA1]|uniref:rhodanese-like domain-containing protein n=1 Tax=Rhodococcus sp. ACPA1 TaxID=2028572 RepID=UPI00359C3534
MFDPNALDPVGVGQCRGGHLEFGGGPGGEATVEFADQVVVPDFHALPHDLVHVLIGVADNDQRPVGRGEPAQPGPDTDQVSRDQLFERARFGKVTVLDVRPREEYEAGHIPGAVSVPWDELADRLADLPEDQEIVAYCRGAYCVLAHDAVRLLTDHGRRAARLADGMLEWRLAALPVDSLA